MNIDANDFFRQATMRICGSLDIETAMWNTLEYLESFIPLTGMNLVLSDPDMAVVETLSQVSRYKVKKIPFKIHWPQEMREDLKRLWKSLKGVDIVNRPHMLPVTQKMSELLGIVDMSTMTLPLKIKDKRLFALVAYAIGADQYTGEHARLLSILHDPFAIVMSNALKHKEVLELKEMLADDNRFLNKELLRISGDEIIGRDKGLKKAFNMVRQVAPLNSPVLLLGETGVGKEVFANAIHYFSPRKNKPFIKVNCGAIPETLMDSELFGHEKGAFTGAVAQKRGRFERAHKGTILLDEIGELPQEAQVRLLRVIQNKEIERVGGIDSIPVDIRIIACTHRDLEKMLISKRFREDLWFRLNVFPIKIPPLRNRKEDIPALVDYFMKKKSIEKNISPPPVVTPGVVDQLKGYHWPGNVRELENFVERTLIRYQGQEISGPVTFEDALFQKTEPEPFHMPVQTYENSEGEKISMHMREILKIVFPYVAPTTSASSEEEPLKLDEVLASHIEKVLKMTRGKVNGPGGAAELLGLNPSTLRSRIRKLGLLTKQTE